MKLLMAGATGLVGTALKPALDKKGIGVTDLVRTEPNIALPEIEWHPNKGEIDPSQIEGFDAVINLAGESIAEGGWTDEKKKRIRDSRVDGTRLLSETFAKLSAPPKVFLCASATGIYGNRGDEILDEDSAPGKGFLAEVCREWEEATEPAINAGVRVVKLRFGPIFSSKGGMLEKLLTPFKLGVGGKIGSGKQYLSWVTIDDVVGAVVFALENERVHGPINIATPNPSTNVEFTKAMGKVLSRPTIFAVPEFAARLAFGEMADEMLLTSQRVLPKRLSEAGFKFQYPVLEAALRHVLSEPPAVAGGP
ncbi:MAG: uncharacterized protein QOE77_1025 [Blastocatellia bacterium]|jgi:uncharacterized protein (TIGR01777 family)|nr:uncharacterized protein [Blastocatellia bacterium]